MLNFKVKSFGFDPYEVTEKFLSQKVPIRISGDNSVVVYGSLDELTHEAKECIYKLPVSEVKNEEDFEFTTEEEKTKLKTSPPFIVRSRPEVKSGELWLVDFGEPFGAEFGYLHYALIGSVNEDGSVRVYPCTSQYHEGTTVYSLNLNPNNLWAVDMSFFNLVEDKMTYIMFHLGRNVAPERFIRRIGTFKEELLPEFEKCIENDYKNQFKKKKVKLYASGIYHISDMQVRMLKDTGRVSNISAIAKNGNLTYDVKLSSILNIFGFYDVDDGKYLFSFVKKAKEMQSVRVEEVMKEVSKGKILNSDVIKDKIVSLIAKRFKYEEPKTDCLVEFTDLVNKLCGSIV